ncbi:MULTISPECIES: DNA mismatch repair endonuclease MutL [unclassified Lentimicrobium]|uniref:DNA mismatch repair endonuclease MutL n=1 Tax=unclassified Lentimicrobium TaxID=2677434 RepID=UPI0015546366|nr:MULTISPECIES: DNA mismatch repair endonuclease MutL [unclassified Lentimicrobium]NPD45808.1 DNA mismatch repair endonuclease MutL [Lentimicrobium sp. S6]NPD85826.1 DNA mismatch repair endonuclease MutL [Lentimicrobium sp. L6]
MADKIKLLPDSVANQIAAGEVIQRPASVVKELLENALDAGASLINLIIKDAGRTLVQITDNGSGMSATDARMCFEKHATSKIKTPDDLFNLNTLGFRGEALASIAAIAQVELKTKTEDEELGTEIIIEGSQFKSQENCSTSTGTSFSVKNLFYNVPARRNFLKSNPAEIRHIIEEFQRVALVHPDVAFNFYNNGNVVYQLKSAPLKVRIAQVIGQKNYEEKLVPIAEQTENLKISGFIGKPEFARKKRGEQYFFANNRFIKHPYFHHAVESAYSELVPDGSTPSYFIFLEVNPEDIDVNIHPTKIEVNFTDKQLIYAVLAASIKKALGQFSLTPSLDFEQEDSMKFEFPADRPVRPPSVKINPDYNPFESEKPEPNPRQESNHENWDKLYDFDTPASSAPSHSSSSFSSPDSFSSDTPDIQPSQHAEWAASSMDMIPEEDSDVKIKSTTFIQLGFTYVISSLKSGLIMIHQQLAHERILYEKYLEQYENRQIASQQLLFPVNINLSVEELSLVREIEEELKGFGFDLEYFGQSGIIINGSPMDVSEGKIPSIIDEILQNIDSGQDPGQERKKAFARSMARQLAIKVGQKLENHEMDQLTDALFSCKVPEVSIDGEPIVKTLSLDEIRNRFLQ